MFLFFWPVKSQGIFACLIAGNRENLLLVLIFSMYPIVLQLFSRYQETDVLPDIVKSHLEKVPIVLEHVLQDTQQLPMTRHNPR